MIEKFEKFEIENAIVIFGGTRSHNPPIGDPELD